MNTSSTLSKNLESTYLVDFFSPIVRQKALELTKDKFQFIQGH